MLRDYQDLSIKLIKSKFKEGHRKVLLKLSTGAGKTVIFCEMLKKTSQNNKKCLLVVRGRELVEQASRRLFQEGVSHGVKMAGAWNKNHQALVQVASIDTLLSRKEFPEADFIVIDEADQATSDGYVKFVGEYPNAYFVSVTATPFTRKSLRHIADTIVNPISSLELIEKGYLVPFRYFAPAAPDLRGVRTQNGEFKNNELEDRMNPLVGNIVSHWKSLAENRATLLFAVNVHHSRSLMESFIKAGVPAEHCDALSDDEERKEIFNRLKSGETKVLCTVGIATRGVDLPWVSCLIMARPTKSYALYLQMLGRGTRPFTNKIDTIILDHASNVVRHGFFTDEPDVEIDGMKREKKTQSIKTCTQCFVVYLGSKCFGCGFVNPKEKSLVIEVSDGVLEELRGLPESVEISIFVRRCKETAKKRGYHSGWVYHQVKDKYGEHIAKQAFPKKRATPWFLRKK